jgi:hypothetical protein
MTCTKRPPDRTCITRASTSSLDTTSDFIGTPSVPRQIAAMIAAA